MSAEKLFTQTQKDTIVIAIKAAEKETSGEIRVHIEKHCVGDVLERAAWWFNKLGMQKTRARNGVLVYLALRSHRFAIIGDEGINKVVPEGFWNSVKEEMESNFVDGKFVEGISHGVMAAGKLMKQHFPYFQEDTNEQPDEISFGD